MTPSLDEAAAERAPLFSAGLALGIGLGGFLDGIVFHQILQLHNMLSARVAPTTVAAIEFNMLWDGLFHAFTWSMTLCGVVLLWRAGRRPDVPWCGRSLWGASLAGFGVFNLVEGVIDHHVLEIHHVVERYGPSAWDWAFLGSGVALIGAGILLIRSAPARRQSARAALPGPARSG